MIGVKADKAKVKILTDLFYDADIDPRKGIISIGGERFFIMPIMMLHSIENKLKQNFGPVTASTFVYDIGKQLGIDILKTMKKAGMKLPSRASEVTLNKSEAGRTLGVFSGTGTTKIREFDFGKKLLRVQWKDGISVQSRNGKVPVCHYTRGALTGAMEDLFGVKLESMETYCEGMGDKYCEAIIAPEELIEELSEEHGR